MAERKQIIINLIGGKKTPLQHSDGTPATQIEVLTKKGRNKPNPFGFINPFDTYKEGQYVGGSTKPRNLLTTIEDLKNQGYKMSRLTKILIKNALAPALIAYNKTLNQLLIKCQAQKLNYKLKIAIKFENKDRMMLGTLRVRRH